MEKSMALKVIDKTTTEQIKENTQPANTVPKQNGGDAAKLSPTLDLMIDLAKTPYTQDIRTYHRLINQIDWTLADAEVLDKALDVTIAFVDMKKTKQLASIGRERFPEHEGIAGAWKLVNPPPAKIIKSIKKTPPNWHQNVNNWLFEHYHEYQIGHWLAIGNGYLVADASTLDDLLKKLEQLNQNGQDEKVLIEKVIL